ncbi:MAG: NAD(P)H-binding protein, partial [Thermoleophilaceae bacterium]|nr:NAD(P)H-binding protein [Thermoleophilaceae bacterium]
MILLTGANGTVGKELLPQLLARGMPVRCLVREPRRLGPLRVEVSIAIGDLGDRYIFSNTLRGVDTVIHLASPTRDQRRGSIEELNGLATRRLVVAAQKHGVERMFFISPIAASLHSPTRFMRSAALAESAVVGAELESTIFKASMIYAADDRYLGTFSKWSKVLPLMPLFGGRDTQFEPLWARDAARAIAAVVAEDAAAVEALAQFDGPIELVGPEVLTNTQILHIATRILGRRRPLVSISPGIAAAAFDWAQKQFGPVVPATRDELALLALTQRSRRGVHDIEALGVAPLPMGKALREAREQQA